MAAARARKRVTPSKTQAVTTGTTIRIEQPKSSRQPKPNVVFVAAQEINPVGGFVGFLREHAIVGLAVGFVVGTQAQALVKQLIASFIDPAFKLLGGQALSQRAVTLHWHDRSADFGWGAFVYGLMNFLFILAAVYAIIKFLNLDELDKPKEEEKAAKK